MKHILFIASCLVLAGCATARNIPVPTVPKVVAHRGYWNTTPEQTAENSLQSLELADRLGVYGSEFDVHLTRDNVPVVYHDDMLSGTETVIQKTDYNDLKDFRLPNGEPIPRLDAFLDNAKTLRVTLVLELKEHENAARDREAARIIVDMVKARGMEGRVDYITFSLEGGKEFIASAPHSRVLYLGGELSPRELKDLGFSGLDYDWAVLDEHPEYYADAKRLGLLVNVWTVNTVDQVLDIAGRGADFITTDIPDKAKAALGQR